MFNKIHITLVKIDFSSINRTIYVLFFILFFFSLFFSQQQLVFAQIDEAIYNLDGNINDYADQERNLTLASQFYDMAVILAGPSNIDIAQSSPFPIDLSPEEMEKWMLPSGYEPGIEKRSTFKFRTLDPIVYYFVFPLLALVFIRLLILYIQNYKTHKKKKIDFRLKHRKKFIITIILSVLSVILITALFFEALWKIHFIWEWGKLWLNAVWIIILPLWFLALVVWIIIYFVKRDKRVYIYTLLFIILILILFGWLSLSRRVQFEESLIIIENRIENYFISPAHALVNEVTNFPEFHRKQNILATNINLEEGKNLFKISSFSEEKMKKAKNDYSSVITTEKVTVIGILLLLMAVLLMIKYLIWKRKAKIEIRESDKSKKRIRLIRLILPFVILIILITLSGDTGWFLFKDWITPINMIKVTTDRSVYSDSDVVTLKFKNNSPWSVRCDMFPRIGKMIDGELQDFFELDGLKISDMSLKIRKPGESWNYNCSNSSGETEKMGCFYSKDPGIYKFAPYCSFSPYLSETLFGRVFGGQFSIDFFTNRVIYSNEFKIEIENINEE